MLRYVQLEEYELSFDETKNWIWLLSPTAERKVNVLFRRLDDSDEMTKELQRPDVSICSMHANVTAVHKNHAGLSNGLDIAAQVLHTPHFESELLKI